VVSFIWDFFPYRKSSCEATNIPIYPKTDKYIQKQALFEALATPLGIASSLYAIQ
jgi:hypothetical protein